MSKRRKCPNCGNGDIQTLDVCSPKNEILKCYECGCMDWDESKRKPPVAAEIVQKLEDKLDSAQWQTQGYNRGIITAIEIVTEAIQKFGGDSNV